MLLLTKESFFDTFGTTGESPAVFFAPGRVNLIGEHTDYNGGYVFPCALTYGTYLAIRRTEDALFHFVSGNQEVKLKVKADDDYHPLSEAWVNYPLGVFDQFKKDGHQFSGLEMYFLGDIPSGAGLSSSASIEVATAYAINTLFSLNYSKVDIAKLCQRAENEFVGMNCGIMDQFTSVLGKADHALFLNCKTLNYVEVPLHLEDHSLVIINTNKKRELVDSKYNERRTECERALKELQAYKRWDFLGEVAIEDFLRAEHVIADDTLVKRAYHVITEDKRVLEAAKSLHRRDLEYFGKLMHASHESLKSLYEVSCYELDVLVEEASNIEGVVGARMTGGGFGGCTVNLVRQDAVDTFIHQVQSRYYKKTGIKADFYLPGIADGARQIE